MLQQLANHSAAAVVAVLTPSMFEDMPYSPALLLDGRFDASIVDTSDFRCSCKHGYEAYFEDMYEVEGDEFVFVERFYTSREVAHEVRDSMLHFNPFFTPHPSFAFRVGCVLGWLSALALVQRDEAIEGLALLWLLVEHEQVTMERPVLTQLSFAA